MNLFKAIFKFVQMKLLYKNLNRGMGKRVEPESTGRVGGDETRIRRVCVIKR